MEQQTITHKFQFPALTGMRALAAFMVFFCHLPLHLHFHILQYYQHAMAGGVTLFFVLSGFLITYRYYPTFQLTGKWFKIYFVKRFARIYPVYFLLATIVMLLNGPYNVTYFIQNYLLVAGFVSSDNLAIAPSWSLTVEEFYYLSAPIVMLMMKRYHMLLPLLIYIVILALVLSFRSSDPNLFVANHSLFMSTLLGRFFEFFIGGFAAIRMLQGRYPTGRKGVKYTVLGVIGILIMLCVITFCLMANGTFKLAGVHLCFALMLPFPVIMLIYGLASERSKLQHLLSTQIADLLGKSSYVFYLLHVPIINYFLPTVNQYHKFRYNLSTVGIFLITLLLSIVIYKYYEAPLNRKIKKSLLKPKKV